VPGDFLVLAINSSKLTNKVRALILHLNSVDTIEMPCNL
jgi:hypothetical protein